MDRPTGCHRCLCAVILSFTSSIADVTDVQTSSIGGELSKMSEAIFPQDWWRLSAEEYKDAKGE